MECKLREINGSYMIMLPKQICDLYTFSVAENENCELAGYDNGYGIQWEKSYGSSPFYSARYEGPQPIGDCDNDGKNEIHAGSVIVESDEDFMAWIFKYG